VTEKSTAAMTEKRWLHARVSERLSDIRRVDRWRAPRSFDGFGFRGTFDQSVEEKVFTSFASNDYLGLSTHPEVLRSAKEAIDKYGTGSGASRLVSGSRPIHHELESLLALHHRSERAVLFSSGYHANIAALTVLGEQDVHLLCDDLNHASLIDGARLSRASVSIYPHCDIQSVADLIKGSTKRCIVVTDTIFSMDGDRAPLETLATLCEATGAALVLDDAHGVLAPTIYPASYPDLDLITVGTLSKTLGAQGGYIAASAPLAALFENVARTYIFTTALSPSSAAAAMASLSLIRSPEGDALRQRLVDLVAKVAGVGAHEVVSPILPFIVGEETASLRAAQVLFERGLYVPAIRPPTVAPGTSRLRVSLGATHSDDDVVHLVDTLAELGLKANQSAH